MGRIGAAHGIKGSLRIKSYTANALDLGKYGPLNDEKGHTYTIKNIRPQKTMVIVRFNEVTSREQAETLNGVELFINQDKLPTELAKEEFYINDLVGMNALDQADTMIGTIVDIPNFGAGDLLEILPASENEKPDQPSFYLAFTKTNVPEINFEKRFVRISPPTEIDEKDIQIDPNQNDLDEESS